MRIRVAGVTAQKGVSCSMTLAGVISLKEQHTSVLQLSLCFCLLLCLFPIIYLFLSTTPSYDFNTRLSRSVFVLVPLHRTHAGWSAQSSVLFNMHSPFLLLYYCPTGDGGPFLWPNNGRRHDREHGGHVPFATPRYLSILPPFSPAVRFSIAP